MMDSMSTEAPQRDRVGRGLLVVVVSVLVLSVVAVALAVAHNRHPVASSNQDLRATGIPASVPTSLAQLMALSPVPTAPAPNFTLTDQNGRRVSLSSWRGKTVVLEFMDPYCVDICPIVSQELVDAYHDLGSQADHVVFVAVNVNAFHRSVKAVAAYSRAHRLDTIPDWHFVTGSPSTLKQVWRDYNVAVHAPTPNADVVHSSVVYFIDPSGHERYAALPMVDHTTAGKAFLPSGPLAEWGTGISLVASSLL